MKTNIKTAFLFCLALFSACSSDNDEPMTEQPTQQPTQEKRYPLTIDVTENPMIVDGDDGGTRAAITTTSTLTQFYMSYVYDGGSSGTGSAFTATKDEVAGKWITTDENYSWPVATAGPGTNVTWYAYTDGTFYYNNGSPYISFSDDEAAMHQKDLLVAKKVDNWNNCNGHLFFAFDHACSALRFSVKKGANLAGYELKITDIKLCNVIKDGKYDLENGTWTLVTDNPSENITNYTLYKSVNNSSITPGITEYDYEVLNGIAEPSEPYLFFIPQELTAWKGQVDPRSDPSCGSYLQIECTITKDNGNTPVFSGTAYYPFSTPQLEKGYQYEVKINIGQNHLKKISGTTVESVI